MPAGLTGSLAALVVVAELSLAVVAALGLPSAEATPWSAYLAAGGAAGLGGLFLLYLLRLLGSPAGEAGCGCSPFSGETSRPSLFPAGGVALAGLLGLVGMAAGGAGSTRYAYGELGGLGLLAAGWGVTLAVLVMVSPEGLRVDARTTVREEPTWMA